MHSEEFIRQSFPKLAAALAYMPVGVTIVDLDLTIRFWNPAFCQLQGFAAEVMHAGISMADVFRLIAQRGDYGPGDIEQQVASRVALCRQFQPHNFTRARDDGVLLNIIGRPTFGEDGAISGFVTIYHDVTSERRHEEQLEAKNRELQEAMRMAEAASLAKGQFLAHMSHEIRTPLNGVIGMAHLALKTELDARQRDYLEKIRFAGEHVLGIIDDILDISKIEAGKMEIQHIEFALDQVVQTVLTVTAPQALERQLELVFEVDPAVPATLVGDPLRLGQVLINYTNNAIKFSEQGTIRISVRPLAADADGCLLRFEVSDQGIGLSEAEMARLFVSFQQADTSTTRAHGGTGLGLAICKQLAGLMGGEVGGAQCARRGQHLLVHGAAGHGGAGRARPDPTAQRGGGRTGGQHPGASAAVGARVAGRGQQFQSANRPRNAGRRRRHRARGQQRRGSADAIAPGRGGLRADGLADALHGRSGSNPPDPRRRQPDPSASAGHDRHRHHGSAAALRRGRHERLHFQTDPAGPDGADHRPVAGRAGAARPGRCAARAQSGHRTGRRSRRDRPVRAGRVAGR